MKISEGGLRIPDGWMSWDQIYGLSDVADVVRAYIAYHEKHGDMAGDECLLSKCPLHYPDSFFGEGYEYSRRSQ